MTPALHGHAAVGSADYHVANAVAEIAATPSTDAWKHDMNRAACEAASIEYVDVNGLSILGALFVLRGADLFREVPSLPFAHAFPAASAADGDEAINVSGVILIEYHTYGARVPFNHSAVPYGEGVD